MTFETSLNEAAVVAWQRRMKAKHGDDIEFTSMGTKNVKPELIHAFKKDQKDKPVSTFNNVLNREVSA